MSAKPELRALTSVRGLAAWWVVFFHLRLAMDGLPEPVLAVAARGYLAVDFFFLLSGFVIWWSSIDRLRDGGISAIPAFLQRRIARIWPLHAVMLGIAVAVALLLWATGRANPHEFPFGDLPWHILLLQNWGFVDSLAWNDPAWSISCELAAYLLFPLLALSIDWRRVPSAAILSAIAALLVLLHTVFAVRGATLLGQDIPAIGLIRCLLEFSCGTGLAALWLRWRERPLVPGLIAAALSAGGFALWGFGAPQTIAVPIAFSALLLALALSCGARHHPLEGRVLHYLGEISYATYLSHFILWFCFKLAFVRDATAVPWWQFVLFAAMTFIASVVLYHGVERPAQRWINALAPPWSVRRSGKLA